PKRRLSTRPELNRAVSARIGKSMPNSSRSSAISVSKPSASTVRIVLFDELGDRAIEPLDVGPDFLIRPIPPGDPKQPLDDAPAESIPDEAGRVAGDDGIGRDIAEDDGPTADDGAVSDAHAADHVRAIPQPDVIADLGVTGGPVGARGIWPVEQQVVER